MPAVERPQVADQVIGADSVSPKDDKSKAPASVSTIRAPSSAATSFISDPHLIWLALPYIVTSLHVLFSPHTKVEETPALHAVHDVMTYGFSSASLNKYEHVRYPGAVPRSIIPSLVIAVITKPLALVARDLGFAKTGLHVQIILRLVLAGLLSISLSHLTITVHRKISPNTAKAFVLLSVTQFHVMYYAGRTLPNFLALPLVVYAFSALLRSEVPSFISKPKSSQKPETGSTKSEVKLLESGPTKQFSFALALLTFTATVIRLEIAPLAVSLALVLVVRGHLSLHRTILSGAIGGFAGLLSTATIDSYFYRNTGHPYTWWPELSAFIFNIAQGRSSDWGVSPWYGYLLDLPKLLLLSLPLALYRVCSVIVGRNELERTRTALLFIPVMAIVAALSQVGHKEWRFIVYVVPLINILAAEQASEWWSIASRNWRILLRLGLLGGVAANLLVTSVMVIISSQNYPGGQVGPILERLSSSQSGKVWIPTAALHTGTTVFALPPALLADRDVNYQNGISGSIEDGVIGNLTIVRPESGYEASARPSGNSPKELWESGYTWVITDDWNSFENMERVDGEKGSWVVVEAIHGFKGIRRYKEWPFVKMETGRRLAIVGRGGS